MNSPKKNLVTFLKNLCTLTGLILFFAALIFFDLVIHAPHSDRDHDKPKPVFDLAWNVLDEECVNKKIQIDCYVYGRLLCTRTLTVGRTKRIRLPDKSFSEFKAECADKNMQVSIADPFTVRWGIGRDEGLGGYAKLDCYEIIVWKIPRVLEDEESFTIISPLKETEYEICYWNVKERRFVRSRSSDGKFFKDEHVSGELGMEYPSGMEKGLVTFSVKSKKNDGHGDGVMQKFEFDRDEKFLPPKPVTRTYIQNGRTITTENLELDGTQWISTRYIDRETGTPVCNRKVQIYFIPENRDEDKDEHLILAETDEEGWLKVGNIPEGGKVYAIF